MAWDDGNESLSASANLAFFFPRDKIIVVNPMDVDGDGTNEALAVAKAVGKHGESFVLEIMDLKPLHAFSKTFLAPFRPQVLFTSPEIKSGYSSAEGATDGVPDGTADGGTVHPIQMTSGQLLIQPPKGRNGHAAAVSAKKGGAIANDAEFNERTRHYFCGSDWHDASTKCKTPCPKGQANECPDDERCFADTPCDALADRRSQEHTQVMFELTPGGGLPSLATLWSDGMVTLHSLTNEKGGGAADATSSDKERKSKKLEIREMWRRRLFPKGLEFEDALWEESNILFLDAYSSVEANAEHGMIVVSGSYFLDGDPTSDRSTFTVAIDAFKGKALWEIHSNIAPVSDDKPLPLPAVRGSTSFARRRSAIARVVNSSGLGSSSASASALPNCMSLLKRHIKEVLPYSYWGPNDAGLAAIHLNQKKKSGDGKNHQASKPHEEKPSPALTKKKWHHRLVHRQHSNSINNLNQPIRARPNALVMQTRGGIQIRSLKNGKALCHLSLLEETLYSDLNNDGVIDQVQILLHSKKNNPSDKFVWNLVAKIQQDHKELKDKGASKKLLLESRPSLCHALALSGLPAKEEIFSAPICGTAHERAGINPTDRLDAVNPLTVESLNGRRNTRDVIVALNSGMVHRLHGTTGRREWALSGRHQENFPTWEEGSSHNALLTRIQAHQVAPPVRPILLVGENSLAVLSVKTGAVLASAVFPQISNSKPVLADVSGDGSTDVIVLTDDGIWGFQIAIHPGSPIALRIMVGLLLMGLMLAVIRNRYGRHDQRSTDE
jgi:hypothetical protein